MIASYNISTEIPIPVHNKEVIDETIAGTTYVYYYNNDTLVATKTIKVDGAITTISVV